MRTSISRLELCTFVYYASTHDYDLVNQVGSASEKNLQLVGLSVRGWRPGWML